MERCCSSTENSCGAVQETRVDLVCPSCGTRGRNVSIQTIQAMLSISLDAIDHESTYRFCNKDGCSTVYFNEKGQAFTESELRVSVFQKHPESEDILVCYCYQHSPNTIRAEIQERGTTDVIERITVETKAGLCACEIRNPQGSCCLGNVRAVVGKLQQENDSK